MPRTPMKNPKTEILRIRVTKQEKQLFAQAADIDGVPTSKWARERLVSTATRMTRKKK